MSAPEERKVWQAVTVPVAGFPLSGKDLVEKSAYFERLTHILLARGLHQHVYLQAWKLSPSTGSSLVSQNAQKWSPALGMGVWPDRPAAASGWTETSFADAGAAVLRGDEPALPASRLVRLDASPRDLTLAAGKLRGFGTQITVFSTLAAHKLEARAKEVFHPLLNESARKAKFIFPVLDMSTLRAARSPAELDRWLCGVDFYIRESAEDKAFLIVSRLALAPILAEMRKARKRQDV